MEYFEPLSNSRIKSYSNLILKRFKEINLGLKRDSFSPGDVIKQRGNVSLNGRGITTDKFEKVELRPDYIFVNIKIIIRFSFRIKTFHVFINKVLSCLVNKLYMPFGVINNF